MCAFFMITKTISAEVVMMAENADDKGKMPSNVLMCRQWWKVCWIYGDQEKYYRYLYGSRKKSQQNGGVDSRDFRIPKISAATTSTTTAVVTVQQQNLIFQNSVE